MESLSDEGSENTTSLVVVISGPSGVGKDVVIDRMIKAESFDFHFTVSVTTRAARPGEVDGVNHHFVNVDQFMNLIRSDELLEWAMVYDNYYGVPRQQVREALTAGNHVIVRVDVQGAKRIKEIVPDALLIFIVPPSLDVLKKHLVKRGVDTEIEMHKRLSAAKEEMNQSNVFDYSVVNEEGQLDCTVDRIVEIIDEESKQRPPRKVSL